MKKKKHQTIKKVKEPKVLDIIVDKGFNLEDYATKGLSGDLRVEGYTFFIEEYDLVLPQQCNVEFVKCKFIHERMCLGSIVVNHRAYFTDCDFASFDTQSARIMVHSEELNTLLFRCCNGNNLLVSGGKQLEIIGCTLNHMHVYNLATFAAVDLSAKYLSLDNISTSVSISKSRLLGLPDCHAPVLEMGLLNTTGVDIDASSICGKFSVILSALQQMSISDTKISTLMFRRSTMYNLIIDQVSKVDIISAKTSACETHSIHPSCPTLTAAYNSAGFNMCSPTIYKKVTLDKLQFGGFLADDIDVILELKVPTYAQARYDEYSHKIRVSAAIPQKIYMIECDKEGHAIAVKETKVPLLARIRSKYDRKFCYKIGKVAKPKEPFDLSERDCASGIHGFLNPMEAAKY